MLLPAVGALEITVILHHAQDGLVHHLGHADRLGDDEGDQVLGRGDHHDPVHGDGLEDGQGHIARSGGHVNEQIVQLAPAHVGPELFDHAAQQAAPPDHRVSLVLQQQVQGDDLDAPGGEFGEDALPVPHGAGVQAEGGGDGGAGDVGVHDAHFITPLGHGGGQGGGGGALAHAALAGHDGVDVLDGRVLVQRCNEVFGVHVLTAGAAGAAVMGTFFRHDRKTSFPLDVDINGRRPPGVRSGIVVDAAADELPE